MTLSVIIIARNEQDVIGRCLESVAWADEIIVVDSHSTDATADVCRAHGARVEVTPDWPGFGPQKNRALALATGDWVLSLDADEWVSTELKAEIQSVLAAPNGRNAFRVPRSSSYCGRFMQHSGWWPDYVARLFKRGTARFSDDLVHERLITDDPPGTLKSALRHEAIRDLDEVLAKTNAYSSAGALMRYQRGEKATLAQAIGHGLWAFIRTYIFRTGFLDGREGFMLAASNAESAYYRYAKLMLLNKARGTEDRESHESD